MQQKNKFTSFIGDALRSALVGSRMYHLWLLGLGALILMGLVAYYRQLTEGLIVTGMNDHVSWGLYISNFTFFVGLAAAAVMLVLPAYILKDVDFKNAVLIGEGVAVSALIMCLLFVTADMGSPSKLWHMIPVVGFFNFPSSMLTWDVLVLNGYLLLNLLIPFYLLYSKYIGVKPNKNHYVPFVFLSVLWAFGIHLVTAFLYAGLPARPFWNSSLLGPRFLASAFAAGPAFIIIVLKLVTHFSEYKIQKETITKLALITTIAAQINLVMLFSELFKEFYFPTGHSSSATYLFFGLDGNNGLMVWIWGSIILNVLATLALSIHRIRMDEKNFLIPICAVLGISIWIEKGMGLIIPGFIPSPLGEIVEYAPSAVEIMVTVGIWAIGMMVLTFLIRIAIPIELGKVKYSSKN